MHGSAESRVGGLERVAVPEGPDAWLCAEHAQLRRPVPVTFPTDLECAICHEPYDARDRVPKTLFCGHTFCLPCLDQWLQLHTHTALESGKQREHDAEEGRTPTCPTCREPMRVHSCVLLQTNDEVITRLERREGGASSVAAVRAPHTNTRDISCIYFDRT